MIILNPVAVLLYLVHLGINVVVLFLVVRLVLSFKKFSWLTSFDAVGKPLVKAVANTVSNFAYTRYNKKLSEKSELLVSLIVLSLIDFVLTCLINISV